MVADHVGGCERGEELHRSVEVGHLHIGSAERVGHVAIAAGATDDAELRSELGRSAIQARQRRLGVEHLDGVDQIGFGQFVERGLAHVATHRVERVGNVDHTALLTYRLRRIEMRDPHRHPFGEEQPDDLASCGAQFLADDHPARQSVAQLDGAVDGVVVGDAHRVEPACHDGCGELIGGRRRVAAPHRVRVQVHTNPTIMLWVGQVGMPDPRLG